jgi:hypothetical protein
MCMRLAPPLCVYLTPRVLSQLYSFLLLDQAAGLSADDPSLPRRPVRVAEVLSVVNPR